MNFWKKCRDLGDNAVTEYNKYAARKEGDHDNLIEKGNEWLGITDYFMEIAEKQRRKGGQKRLIYEDNMKKASDYILLSQ